MGEGRTTTSLATWLDENGLEGCEPLFAAADVDMGIVADLTEDDLREIGLSLGQRRKAARGIARLRREAPANEERRKPERRQISVLFTDLIGSTRLSTLFDAEDWASILQEYHGICATSADNWGGRMTSQFGDGCMAIFGHPRINEDDAERAVHAGLEMIERIAAAGPFDGQSLKIRVAIATGRVVIGDLTGSADPNALAGETPNLASRLQEIADPQTLVIAPATKRLVSHAFEFQSRGVHELKGFAGSVEAWRVAGAREPDSRYYASGADQAIIGREAELEALSGDWAEAQAGGARVVFLTGEPGIGKSQLASAFAQRLEKAHPDLRRLRYFCSPFRANSAFHPFQQQFAWSAGVTGKDDAKAAGDKIRDFARGHPAISDQEAALIEAQLSAASPDRLDMNAQQRKLALLDLVETLVRHEASEGPVLIEFEDAHWADATSLDALARIAGVGAAAAPERPVMILITHRPGFAPRWPDCDWVRRMTLGRLANDEAARLARRVLGDGASAARIRDITDKADGVPLYLHEIALAVAESGGGGAGDAIQVPDSLEDSLMARVDRLGADAKEVAQFAATLGRVFQFDLLAVASEIAPATISVALDRLTEAEVIRPAGGDDAGAYIFRHALIQDAAYASLLNRESREIHGRVARILSSDAAGSLAAEPEVLARHFAGAGMPLQAVAKLIEAGQAATARAAQIEANAHFRAALELLDAAPDGPDAMAMEATSRALLGQSLIATLGFGATEISDNFAQARKLSETVENTPLLMSSLYGLWTVAAARGERDRARAYAAEAMALFRDSNQPLFALGAHFMDGVTKLYQGEFAAADDALRQVIAIYDPALHPYSMQAFGDDLGTFALTYLQWISSLRGDFIETNALNERNMALTAELGDKQVETRLLGFLASGAVGVGAVEMAMDLSGQLIEQAAERCYPHWIAVGKICRGWARTVGDEDPAGIDELREGVGFFNMIGQRTPLSLANTKLVEALMRLGRIEEAATAAEAGIKACRDELDAVYLLDLMRMQGECLAHSDPQAGQAAVMRAFESAAGEGLGFFRIRAAISLARMCAGGPDAAAAIDRLRAARAEIREPFPLPFVLEAESLLAQAA